MKKTAKVGVSLGVAALLIVVSLQGFALVCGIDDPPDEDPYGDGPLCMGFDPTDEDPYGLALCMGFKQLDDDKQLDEDDEPALSMGFKQEDKGLWNMVCGIDDPPDEDYYGLALCMGFDDPDEGDGPI